MNAYQYQEPLANIFMEIYFLRYRFRGNGKVKWRYCYNGNGEPVCVVLNVKKTNKYILDFGFQHVIFKWQFTSSREKRREEKRFGDDGLYNKWINKQEITKNKPSYGLYLYQHTLTLLSCFSAPCCQVWACEDIFDSTQSQEHQIWYDV